MRTPAEAAYLAWVNGCEYITFKDFDDLNPNDKLLWTAIADAVIEQSKTIIAEEMAKALTKPPASNEAMNALMWYAGNRSVEARLKDNGDRAAKALRAVITQPTASTPQT